MLRGLDRPNLAIRETSSPQTETSREGQVLKMAKRRAFMKDSSRSSSVKAKVGESGKTLVTKEKKLSRQASF